jgi:hypothetical protein
MSSPKRESVRVLEECIDLQKRKSRDYQNDRSNVKQAMHYRRGVSTIHDMISQKLLRAQSLLEAYENGESSTPNFESLEDTYKDLINYSSFAVSYIRGKMEGQNHILYDMLNRKRSEEDQEKMVFEELALIDEESDTPGETIAADIIRNRKDTEEVEEDGFITVIPTLFPKSDKQKIKKRPGKNASTEEKIKSAYFGEVAPKGEVRIPRGEVNCTDPVQHAYIKNIQDIGDRLEGDFDELAKKQSER